MIRIPSLQDVLKNLLFLTAFFSLGEVSTASINFKSLPYLLPDTNVRYVNTPSSCFTCLLETS